MDDLSTIFYIVIGIIYFIYSAIKKSKTKNVPRNRPGSPIPGELNEDTQEPHEEPMTRRPSFEDLLREFTQETPEAPKEVIEETYEEPEDTYEPEYTYNEEKKTTSIYNEYQNIHVTEEDIVGKSLFDAYDTDEDTRNKFGAEIREMLKNPEGLKKAIIVNEILKPKYF